MGQYFMRVSVIVPVYNMASFVEECINSILTQTLTDIEIICVNDGSTDGSLQILESIQKRDTRLRILTTHNRGVAKARNLGISHAVGDFVCFIDPDDFYPNSTVLQRMYDKSNGFNIVGGSLAIFDNKKKTIRTSFRGEEGKYIFAADGELTFSRYQFDYGFTRFIYRRDFLISNNLYFPDLVGHEDPPFFVEAMLAAGKFYALKDIVYLYRKNHKEASNFWSNPRKVVDSIKGISMVLELAANNELMDLYKISLKHLDELNAEIAKLYPSIRNCPNKESYWFVKKPIFLRR